MGKALLQGLLTWCSRFFLHVVQVLAQPDITYLQRRGEELRGFSMKISGISWKEMLPTSTICHEDF